MKWTKFCTSASGFSRIGVRSFPWKTQRSLSGTPPKFARVGRRSIRLTSDLDSRRPQQSAASGLPLYQAHGGWASIGATVLVGYSLKGDLRKKGLSLFAVGSYSRLLNDARDNPYTAIRGTPNQWVGGGGLAVMF